MSNGQPRWNKINKAIQKNKYDTKIYIKISGLTQIRYYKND